MLEPTHLSPLPLSFRVAGFKTYAQRDSYDLIYLSPPFPSSLRIQANVDYPVITVQLL